MRTILKSILLMSLCSSATAPAMAINRANHDKKDANIHEEETNDSTRHQPLTESGVKLNEVVVTGLTGSQKLKQSPALSPSFLPASSKCNLLPTSSTHRPPARRFADYHGKRNFKARNPWPGL